MKKVVFGGALALSLVFTSCGIDVDKAAEEFCACKEKEGDEKDKCHDEWVEKYKGSTGSEEDGEKLGKKMVECDPGGALKVIPKLQDK